MPKGNKKLARCVPPGYALRVAHIHDRETLKMFSHGRPPKYLTLARIYRDVRLHDGRLDMTDDNPPVVEVEARCNPGDNPDRKVGYKLAVVRALRALSRANREARFIMQQGGQASATGRVVDSVMHGDFG